MSEIWRAVLNIYDYFRTERKQEGTSARERERERERERVSGIERKRESIMWKTSKN